MSEIFLKHVNALIASAVEPKSIAERKGIRVGDHLKRINQKPIIDILDYRFHSTSNRLVMELERDGEPYTVTLRKGEDEDLGLQFEHDLGDRVHTCKNKCVFCFIHQQPKKMRKSLYLMDDDFRLSFMHGNYVTLTNISAEEWARILEQRLSPLYVSVHATNPELRRLLLGRKEPTPILPQIRELADNRISVHAQIVLCPGWNDGEALLQTLDELVEEHPLVTRKRTGVESVAVVPVGMTRFRERLPSIEKVERDYAREMIAVIDKKERAFQKRIGTRFVWLADEWYHIAELPYPNKSHYEEFPQLEDGIGTVRLFLESAKQVARKLPESVPIPIRATLVTAEMPAVNIHEFANRLNAIEGVEVNVCVIHNNFFGGDIHIAGLMTATDIIEQIGAFEECHQIVYIPQIAVRDEVLFLDDMTVSDVRTRSGKDIRIVGNSPQALAEAMGLIRSSNRQHDHQPTWVMEESVV